MALASALLIALPELVEATTNTIFAPGAMAWAYSTSKLVSIAQPNKPWRVLAVIGVAGHPAGSHRMVNDGGAGMPKRLSNKARSFGIVGLPKASTIRMVWPVPSRPVGKL